MLQLHLRAEAKPWMRVVVNFTAPQWQEPLRVIGSGEVVSIITFLWAETAMGAIGESAQLRDEHTGQLLFVEVTYAREEKIAVSCASWLIAYK